MIDFRFSGPVLAGVMLSLAACGNGPSGPSLESEMLGATRALLQRSTSTQPTLRPTDGFPGLDPALIAGQPGPLMGAYLETSQALAALSLAGTNGSTQTWFTADQVAMSLSDGGLLVSTRGLRDDLQAADVRQTAALIAAGQSGRAQRRHVYMDGVMVRTSLVLACDVQQVGSQTIVLNSLSYRTLRFEEQCRAEGVTFTNQYWRDASGPVIRQSSQWISPTVGTVHLQRLIP
jgi:hypothetical protein